MTVLRTEVFRGLKDGFVCATFFGECMVLLLVWLPFRLVVSGQTFLG